MSLRITKRMLKGDLTVQRLDRKSRANARAMGKQCARFIAERLAVVANAEATGLVRKGRRLARS